MDEYVTVQQVAEAAQVRTQTVRTWIAEERIEIFVKGDRRRQFIRRDDAEFLLSPRVVRRGSTAKPAQVGI